MKSNKSIKLVEIPIRFYCDNCNKDNLDFEDMNRFFNSKGAFYECKKCNVHDEYFTGIVESLNVYKVIPTIFDIGGPYKSIIGRENVT